jgi:hypothetical protein
LRRPRYLLCIDDQPKGYVHLPPGVKYTTDQINKWGVLIVTTTRVTSLIALLGCLMMWPLFTAAQSDEIPVITNGQIEEFLFADQVNEYYFLATAGDRVTIRVDRTSGNADMLLELYGPDQALLFTDDDSGRGLDPLISGVPLPVSGRYRVVVTRCSFCNVSTSAGYTLGLSGVTESDTPDAEADTQSDRSIRSVILGQQERTTSDDCSIDEIAESISLMTDTAADGRALLSELMNYASLKRAECDGLVFSSTEYGLQPFIGPVEIDPGMYRAQVVTEGFFIAHVTPSEGSCEGVSFGSLFNVSSGIASDGAQTGFTSQGCVAFIEISNTREPWTLTFEKLG